MYSKCSKPCGGGIQIRSRTCNDSVNNGEHCLLTDGGGKAGSKEIQSLMCNTEACPGNYLDLLL